MKKEACSVEILMYFLSLVVLTMLTLNPTLLFISYFGAILCNFYLFGLKKTLKSVAFSFVIIVVAAVINPIFVHGGVTPLFFLNGRAYTFEAIIYGICAGLMLVSVFLWFKCFSFLFTSDKFIAVFSRRMPRFGLMLSMSLGLIPRMMRQFKRVDLAQKGMGMYAGGGVIDRILGKLRVILAVLGMSLEGGIEMADSMSARGYGLKTRVRHRLGFKNVHRLIFIGFLAVFALVFMCFAGGVVFYPRIKIFKFGVFDVLSAVFLCLLSFYWSVCGFFREVRWHYLRLKI